MPSPLQLFRSNSPPPLQVLADQPFCFQTVSFKSVDCLPILLNARATHFSTHTHRGEDHPGQGEGLLVLPRCSSRRNCVIASMQAVGALLLVILPPLVLASAQCEDNDDCTVKCYPGISCISSPSPFVVLLLQKQQSPIQNQSKSQCWQVQPIIDSVPYCTVIGGDSWLPLLLMLHD